MRAMVLDAPGKPLVERELPDPVPGDHQVRLRMGACAVCRTDLHVADGELPDPKLPLILGHQVVGTVEALGSSVKQLRVGQRIGVPWLGWTDGTCPYCTSGRENLCDRARFTGYLLDGGFAERCLADGRYCFPLADGDDAHQAPLLCAGAIGYRALRLAGDGARRLGFYGFGAAAHLMTELAVAQGREVYAFTRPGDQRAQAFARSLGATWTGSSAARPPVLLDAAILFAPVGALVPLALAAVAKGGTVVCGGIHMSDIPAMPYSLLWGERVVRSVANLTRRDGEELLALAARHHLRTTVTRFPLGDANRALAALRGGHLEGAAVLVP